MKKLARFSIGTGDRFGMEGKAQIEALARLRALGIEADIVWNKSNREHQIIGTTPRHQREAAERAIVASGWHGAWFVDADHIGLATVEPFLPWCNFFTIDVADFIGKEADAESIQVFVQRAAPFLTRESCPISMDRAVVEASARKYLRAIQEAAAVYRHIAEARPSGDYVLELSVDETDEPQTPAELACMLAAIGLEGIPLSTLAPRFPGKFLKGLDYIGDTSLFLRVFEDEVKILKWAQTVFELPEGLKLSVHSGSDKFSLYKGMHAVLMRTGAGVHLKTAGTTWLEEIIGLAEAGGEGLAIVRQIYRQAHAALDELVAPYAAVVSIDRTLLPLPDEVDQWTSEKLAMALRHDLGTSPMNPSMRQLMHVGYRMAAAMGQPFLDALARYREPIERNVTKNLLERHLIPLFDGSMSDIA
ncbi:MAG: tagaturonate epimerase family protein [Spirochaetales bacterium]|nr:tagaturonate epimerase family protein [Spirochaetales bacterium]